MLAAAGDKRIMPDPDFPAIGLICSNSYSRASGSWVIERIVGDIEYWMLPSLKKNYMPFQFASKRWRVSGLIRRTIRRSMKGCCDHRRSSREVLIC